MSKPVEKGPKKPYTPPKMTVYGTVRDLTKTVGTHGGPDGGHILGHTKTHV